MAADQLLARVVGDLGEVARAALLEQQREEVDLEEDVAELVDAASRRRRRCAASASSYASSTVCGTIVRSSCSRSHGHSRRSRRVISIQARERLGDLPWRLAQVVVVGVEDVAGGAVVVPPGVVVVDVVGAL